LISWVWTSLREAARALPLGELVVSLSRVCDRLDLGRAASGAVGSLKEGVAALGELASRLDRLIAEHDRWQTLDVELMRTEAEGLAELEGSWPDLKKETDGQCEGHTEEWVPLLAQDAEKLTQAIAAKELNQIRQYFRRFRTRVSRQFYQADLMLKKLCEELARVGEPLAKVLKSLVPGATSLQTYPRYSTALFLSRTTTDESGSARQSVALEPSSKLILI
jgi:hypothetical protein